MSPDLRTGTPAPSASPGPVPRSAAMGALLAHNWWAIVLRGVCAIIFGAIAILAPAAAILSLVLLFSAYMFVDGVLGILAGVRAARAGERWGLLIAEGVLNLIVAVVALLWPAAAALAFELVIAAWAILTGALLAVAAFRLDKAYGRWWLALGGVVSIVFGVLLVIAPVAGLVVLTWWLGGYALAFGVMLLILGFKLRSCKEEATTAGSTSASRA